MRVPRLNLSVEDAPISAKIQAAIARVIDSGQFIGGDEIRELEYALREVVDLYETAVPRSVVTCASGTDAVALALMGACALHDGDQFSEPPVVVVPALTFSASASAVIRAGMQPRFVDVDPETLLIDWPKAQDEASRATGMRTILPVHLYGRVARPPANFARDATIVEDACQAFGLEGVGAIGTAAAFSFFPSKPLGCYGDGGAVACPATLARHIRALAHHGSTRKYVSDNVGFNSRLDAIQAAILRVKLPYVEAHRQARARIAALYHAQLGDLEWLRLPELVSEHTWHCFAVRVHARRDAFVQHLLENGVDCAVHYPVPLHRQQAFSPYALDVELPHAEKACEELASLPIWSGMTQLQIERVIAAVRAFD